MTQLKVAHIDAGFMVRLGGGVTLKGVMAIWNDPSRQLVDTIMEEFHNGHRVIAVFISKEVPK